MAKLGQKIAQKLLFQPAGQPCGPLLRIAGLNAEEEPPGGLADTLTGAGNQGLAAAGNAAGNGRFLGELAGGDSNRVATPAQTGLRPARNKEEGAYPAM